MEKVSDVANKVLSFTIIMVSDYRIYGGFGGQAGRIIWA